MNVERRRFFARVASFAAGLVAAPHVKAAPAAVVRPKITGLTNFPARAGNFTTMSKNDWLAMDDLVLRAWCTQIRVHADLMPYKE